MTTRGRNRRIPAPPIVEPAASVRYSFNFIFIVIYFLRAIAHLNARAGSRGSRFTPVFFSTVRDGLAKARAPRPRAAHLSLRTPKNLVSRDGSGNTFSLPYMVYLQEVIIPRSRERGLILCKLSTNAVQAPHELPLDRNASRYTQCRVRKQSNECESEKRLVKSQRSGVALTERGGSWGLDGSCFAAIAAERPLCAHETISTIFFQPVASTGLYQFVRNFRSILEHVSFRSPSHFVRLHGKTHRLFFSGRSSNGTASIWTAFLYARSRT